MLGHVLQNMEQNNADLRCEPRFLVYWLSGR